VRQRPSLLAVVEPPPSGPRRSASDPSGASPDPLEVLRQRIDATHEAAVRLARETAESARAESAGRVPPKGWDVPRSGQDAASELQALIALADTLRGVLPEDIQHQLKELVHQLLVLLRSLIDWWITRIERQGHGDEVEVEDIPIS
jgi:hypothetical protein